MGRKWNWLHGNGREWERKNPFPVISRWQLWRMMHIATILVATRGRIAGALLRLTLSLSTAGKHAAVLRITLTLSSMPPRESQGVPSMSFKKCPLRGEMWVPHWNPQRTRFLGLTQVHNPNGISVGSAVLPVLTVVSDTHTHTHTHTHRPRNIANNRQRTRHQWSVIRLTRRWQF